MTPTNILNSLCFLAVLCNYSLELSPAVSVFLVTFIILVFSFHSIKFGITMYNDHFIDKALRNKHMKSVLAEIISQKPRLQSMPIKKNWYDLDAFQIFFYLSRALPPHQRSLHWKDIFCPFSFSKENQ